LVVDDHDRVRQAICRIVSTEFQVICETASGEDAVAKAEQHLPDLVLLDISLPGINGFEAAKRIRAVSPLSRIIFVSQHDEKEVVRKAFLSGGSGYVVKSQAGSSLLDAIRTVLNGEQHMDDNFTSTLDPVS
jgi:two-component system, NarL family, invasion response regulator UvrY